MFSSNPPESSSMTAVSPPPIFRFGTFEVDVGAGELRKHGLHIKLQDQPFHLLVLLLQHPGQVVTRDELRHTLWSDHTFVDFDRGLNRAMNKLRRALCDSAETPRFIETLHRRGYRFIAPVTVHYQEQANPDPQHGSVSETKARVDPEPFLRRSTDTQKAKPASWWASSIPRYYMALLVVAMVAVSLNYVRTRSAASYPS